ncbi:MAG: hypothetical protein Tp176DCM1853251_1 [Prokaryotic dsDNA virus sp.]|nr:MAG: hypothetical protein Tp176DCM1853251_1 [Prokaryotic dsDNA virus sp.]|tara:strand:- start:224 stop:601 length:378 start_codon:yes stop_codon:yes gene_type:complete
MHDSLGDNPVLQVNGISLERMRYAMRLAYGFPAHGFRIDKERGWLVFLKYESSPNMTAFPVPLDADRCADIAFDWLKAQPYPSEPDHDGDNEKGWLIWKDSWGKIEGHDYHSFLGVRPAWIIFGK